jgi:type II secretory pathway pseudopilin PulG
MDKERGFTLLQLMITVAVMGVLLVVFDKLTVAGLRGWAKSKKGYEVQQSTREAKDQITKALRSAKANTVLISRYRRLSSGGVQAYQPPCSMVTFVDTQGNSRAIFQDGGSIKYTTWSGTNPYSLTPNANDLYVRDIAQRFSVYYPNPKDYTQIAFSFAVKTRAWANDERDMELLVTDVVEMKAP